MEILMIEWAMSLHQNKIRIRSYEENPAVPASAPVFSSFQSLWTRSAFSPTQIHIPLKLGGYAVWPSLLLELTLSSWKFARLYL